jgi:cytochrome c
MSDPLAFNKIIAGFLCACLLLIGAGKFASFMQGGDEHHGDHHSEDEHSLSKNAYPIEVPEASITETSAIVSTPVKIVPILALIATANIDAGKKLSKKCAACHSFNAGGPNKVGPNLWNVLNREIGKVDSYKYSKALTAFGGEWNYSSLNKFLIKPKEYIKGTKMNYAGLRKEKDRANILLWLRSLAENPADLPTEDEIQQEIDALNS